MRIPTKAAVKVTFEVRRRASRALFTSYGRRSPARRQFIEDKRAERAISGSLGFGAVPETQRREETSYEKRDRATRRRGRGLHSTGKRCAGGHRKLVPGSWKALSRVPGPLSCRYLAFPSSAEKILPACLPRSRVSKTAYRLDLVVGNRLLFELKAVDANRPIHQAQVVTYTEDFSIFRWAC